MILLIKDLTVKKLNRKRGSTKEFVYVLKKFTFLNYADNILTCLDF